ncbi:MAG: hypothetical protein HDR15_04260 [Lachnospiraceae bacterium]|nr:hypothetical protein [Lachnospiraceae bacterium]
MEDKKIKRHKQIAAIIGIALLVAMYLVTFILALCRFDGASSLFMGALACTIVVPVLIWIYIWLYGLLTRKKTIATLFPDAPSEEEVLNARLAAADAADGQTDAMDAAEEHVSADEEN